MPSHSSGAARRSPQQDRSTRRVNEFLEAAEALFADLGFEATTMTGIAERAGSSIGALYGYFPDKKAVAIALLDTYAKQIEEHWHPLLARIALLSHEEFASQLIDRFLQFVSDHPAFVQLVTGPIRLRRSSSAKRAFRVPLIHALQLRVPGMPQQNAELRANIILHMLSSMMQMYHDQDASRRAFVSDEFKTALSAYLGVLFTQRG